MKISIISKDERYKLLNEELNCLGYDSKINEITDCIRADVLILSVRKEFNSREYNELLKKSEIKTILAPKYIDNSIDYTDNEEFLKKNAYLTAEGAISLYYNTVRETLLSKRVLILGYGRISKYLSKILKGLNCDVSIFARRKEVQNEIILDGFKPTTLKNDGYDIVFNTIPEPIVLDNEFESCICIELANGFITKDKVINGNGLPGKMFPKVSSKFILEAILPYIS